MPELKKQSTLENYKFLHVNGKDKKAILIATEEDLQRQVEDLTIKDGDLIIHLTEETLRVAELVHHIKLL